MNIPKGFNVLKTYNPRNAIYAYSRGLLTIYSTTILSEKDVNLLVSYSRRDSLVLYYKDGKRFTDGNEVLPVTSGIHTNGSMLSMRIDEETFANLCLFLPCIFNPTSVADVGITSEIVGGYVHIDGVFHSYHEGFRYSYNFVTTDEFDTDRIVKDLNLLIAGVLVRRGNYIKNAFLPEATALIPKIKSLGMIDEFLFNMSKYVGTFKAITFDKRLESPTVLYIPEHLKVGLRKNGFIFNTPVVEAVESSMTSDSVLNDLTGTLMLELPHLSIIPDSFIVIERHFAKVNSLLEEAKNLLSSIQNGSCTAKASNVRMLVGLIDVYTNLRGRLISVLFN